MPPASTPTGRTAARRSLPEPVFSPALETEPPRYRPKSGVNSRPRKLWLRGPCHMACRQHIRGARLAMCEPRSGPILAVGQARTDETRFPNDPGSSARAVQDPFLSVHTGRMAKIGPDPGPKLRNVLRNRASGPELDLPGRMSAGFWSAEIQNPPTGRPEGPFEAFPTRIRPNSSPEARFPGPEALLRRVGGTHLLAARRPGSQVPGLPHRCRIP